MRFDDMIDTVLAQPPARVPDRDATWRQLVDLLAQRRDRGSSERVDQALGWLRRHRQQVPLEVRRQSARALAGLRVDPQLVRFFADDHPTVAAPLFRSARLSAAEWLRILPALGPTGRSLLRHRRDLDPSVIDALAAFGSSDFALEGEVEANPPDHGREAASVSDGEAQIRNLVARIEAFRKHKTVAVAAPVASPDPAESFRWETGSDGLIMWVEGAPRGPLVGQTIATAAPGRSGVDGQAAGAFEKRAPFRDARFSVPGGGPACGDWRISGVPFFDPARGNFLGYRGSARRPRPGEVAQPGEERVPGVFGKNFPADSLRQLIHELRTPLNAILGFAEMIDGQYMGPAASGYRDRAGDIMAQARRLLSAVDDLDTAAQIETRRLDLEETCVDAVALLCRLHDSYERAAGERGARIAVEIDRDLPFAQVEPNAAERMFARMLAATIGLAEDFETIAATLRMEVLGGRKMLCLAIERPRAIAGTPETALLDPGYSPEGDWPEAPALGLGFALRLVRNLAEAVGGALKIGDRLFSLYLPPQLPAKRSGEQGGEGAG
jgi:hypothetical protein